MAEFIKSNYTKVNFFLIIINVGVFLFLSVKGSTTDAVFMIEHGAMLVPCITQGHEYYRFFTCIFMHFGLEHLISNMLALYFMGDNLERAMGKVRYLLVYLGSGLGGSICSFLFLSLFEYNTVSAGASGAIFGVIGALLYVVIRNKGKLEDLTTFRVALLIGYCIFSGLSNKTIDNAAHIGGLLAGFLLSVVLYRKKKRAEWIVSSDGEVVEWYED
ncbi:MAG TPA: rhomboid family intramembrane serine protease [Lachnospiraceae bacterium]|jgi:rhomboid protease GluP|nr:rhomboid family intramembrane serine protease [Lachnospiraceae bacterium]